VQRRQAGLLIIWGGAKIEGQKESSKGLVVQNWPGTEATRRPTLKGVPGSSAPRVTTAAGRR